MDLQLIDPCQDYKDAFLDFYTDFWENDPVNSGFYVEGVRDFEPYVMGLHAEAQGIDLLDGHVPCNHYWLVASGSILGVIRIRHNIESRFLREEAGHIGYDMAPRFRRRGLGSRMLAIGLKRAAIIGLKRVMISADEDNVASRNVIESNGGILDSIVQGKVFECAIARYWISL